MVNIRVPTVLENPGKSLNLNKNSRPVKSLKIDKVLENPGKVLEFYISPVYTSKFI
jgi:hypothetical protein